MLSKNHKARMRKVVQGLDRTLDALHRANGELYPVELAEPRAAVQAAIQAAQEAGRVVSRLMTEEPAAEVVLTDEQSDDAQAA